MKISVIIPVHNVQEYLPQMLNSVIKQTLNRAEYEIIAIDDMSTDKSYEILKSYSKKIDKVLQVKENIGQGAVRNFGLNLAKGKYVMFLDSDDLILENTLEVMLNAIESNEEIDIATGTYKRFNSMREVRSINQNLYETDKITTLKETPELLFELTPWNKIFRKSFLEDIKFKWLEQKLYEDLPPNFLALNKARKIKIIPNLVYMWRMREKGKSVTQSKDEIANIQDRYTVLKMMYEYLDEINDINIKNCLEQRIYMDFSYYLFDLDNLGQKQLEYVRDKVIPFLKILDRSNLEIFNDYRLVTDKVEKKRYSVILEALNKDIFSITSRNKFTIMASDEKQLSKKIKKIKDEDLKYMRFILVGSKNTTLNNVECFNNFSEVDNLLNTYIVYNEEFKSIGQLKYLNGLISNRLINLIFFNKTWKIKNHEIVDYYENSSSNENKINFPIFLSTVNSGKTLEEVYNNSTKGKNSIVYHSNVFYKQSKVFLKYKETKLVYKIYSFFK